MLSISDETKKLFPYANDKAIVDFVNNIAVLKDLNETSKNTGRLQNFLQILTGKDKIRQESFENYLIEQLDSSRVFIQSLMEDVGKHATALTKIENSLQYTHDKLGALTEKLIDFRSSVEQEFKLIRDELDSLEQRMTIGEHKDYIDMFFSAWKAGNYNMLSPLSRCYHIADSLYWKGFRQENRGYLETELINQLKSDFDIKDKMILISRNDWLVSGDENQEICTTLQYLGDWTLDDPIYNDTALIATQGKTFLALEENRYIAPMSMSIEQAVKRIVTEVCLRDQ